MTAINISYKNRLILAGARLIAINKGRYYQRNDGPALGPGPFVTALEYATDKKAEVVGKPEKSFFLSALEGLGCSPNEAVMIGDVCISFLINGIQLIETLLGIFRKVHKIQI